MAYDRIELEKVSFNLVISINLYGKEKIRCRSRMLLGKIRGIFEYKIEEGNSNIAVAVMDRLNGTYINSPVNKIYKKSIIIVIFGKNSKEVMKSES